jgi:hypothetical protein
MEYNLNKLGRMVFEQEENFFFGSSQNLWGI